MVRRDVLRILRRRSLAALRAQVEPVSTAAYGRFLPAWQHVGVSGSSGTSGDAGLEGLASVIDQLAGVRIPRLGDRTAGADATGPRLLTGDARRVARAGEITWSGAGSISGSDGWIALHPADSAPLTLAASRDRFHRRAPGDPGHAVRGGAYFFRQLAQGEIGETALKAALWELIWAGWVTGDTFAPVRALLAAPVHASVPRRRTEHAAHRA